MRQHGPTLPRTDKASGAFRIWSGAQVPATRLGRFSKAYRFPFEEVLASLEVNTELNNAQERALYA